MNRRLAAPDHSLNAPMRAYSDVEWVGWLVDETPDQETVLGDSEEFAGRRALLRKAMKGLNERERYIFAERRLKGRADHARESQQRVMASAAERVRQIEVRAFEKVQKAIKNAAIEQRLA